MSRLAARVVCCALLVAACGCSDPSRWPHALTPLEQLPWPAPAAAPAGCDPLPVWALTIAPADLAGNVADPHGNRYVAATLTVAGTPHPARVRLHGGTSRDFVKKSFRIDLPEGDSIGGRRRLILRGEWNDKSLLRTYLAYELFRTATWLPTPQAEHVHLEVNGEFYGVMLHVERIDAEFLAARRLDRAGSLIEADPALGGQPGNLRPMEASAYASVYEAHGDGPHDLAVLRDLVERVLTMKPHAFADEAARAIAVDDVLVYLAGMAVLQNHDHVRKNYYLYRPGDGSRGWMVLPWDLDLTFGHMWSPAEDVLGESIVTDADPFAGALIGGQGQENALVERLLAYPALRARMLAMAGRLAAHAASPAFLDARIDRFLCRARADIAADLRKRATNDEYAARVDEIRQFVPRRRAFLAAVE